MERKEGKSRMIFVNLPVKDLGKTKRFFASLGFGFNPQFTDDKAACMVIGEDSFAMLLVEEFFQGFIPGRSISDTRSHTEAILAISAGSRRAVDEMVEKAHSAGGSEYREAQDHGWMYGRAFKDPDGHIWEVMYMDMGKMPMEMRNKK